MNAVNSGNAVVFGRVRRCIYRKMAFGPRKGRNHPLELMLGFLIRLDSQHYAAFTRLRIFSCCLARMRPTAIASITVSANVHRQCHFSQPTNEWNFNNH